MYRCDLCGAGKPEDCICTEHQKEAYSHQASSFHDAIGGWRKDNEFLKNELTQKEARIRELEDALKAIVERQINLDCNCDHCIEGRVAFEQAKNALSEKSDKEE